MINIALASSGEWIKVFSVVAGLFIGVYILATVYSKLTEKTGVRDKDGCGWPIFLVVVAIIVGFLVSLKKCKGDSYKSDNTEWQYKHTDKHY